MTLSEHAKTLAQAVQADLDQWAGTMATYGVGGLLTTLHPEITWMGQSLRIAKPFDETSRLADSDLVIAPNVLGPPRLAVQVCDPRNAVLRLPVRRSMGDRAGALSLASLVGVSRAAILMDLATPSSTTELSRRHGLAPSTVSHHLGVLLNSGLVHRHRSGAVVQYRRSQQGDSLVDNSRSEPPHRT
jgi:DNA-binding transcriptional ArsR family regulator